MISWIDDSLAIGTSEDADTPEQLSRSDIDIVIDIRNLFDYTDPDDWETAYPIPKKINRVVGLLHDLTEQGWKVMIKCFAGRDRSPFIAMLYIRKKQNLVAHDAYQYVMGKRPQTRPNYEWFDMMMEAIE